MATWFRIEFEGEPTEADFARVAELAAEGFTSGQLLNDPVPAYPQRGDYDGYAAYIEAVETWEAENGADEAGDYEPRLSASGYPLPKPNDY